MFRVVLALVPWLLVPSCATFCVGWSRTPMSLTIGWELVFIDLWQPVGEWGLFALLGTVPLAFLAFLLHRSCRRRAFSGLWDRICSPVWLALCVGLFLVFPAAHELLCTLPVAILALQLDRSCAPRTRSEIWNRVGSPIWLALCVGLFLASSLAHEEAWRTPQRQKSEAFEDFAPARLGAMGLFDGPWQDTATLSYSLFLASLLCFGGWLAARAWSATRGIHNAGPCEHGTDGPPNSAG